MPKDKKELLGRFEDRMEAQRQKVIKCLVDYLEEARTNEKVLRRDRNKFNWQMFHGNIDWSHKKGGDARIHLHKVGLAAERTRAKFKEGLMQFDKWLHVEETPGFNSEEKVMSQGPAKKLMRSQLEKSDAKTALSDALLIGTVEGRATINIGSKMVEEPRYMASGSQLLKSAKKRWQLCIEPRLFEQYLCDPFDRDLYEFEELVVDRYQVDDLASEDPKGLKPYRKAAADKMATIGFSDADDANREAEGEQQKVNETTRRMIARIHNFYGTVLDEKGKVFEWEVSEGKFKRLENVFITLGNETQMLRDPSSIPRWTGKSPLISATLLRSPKKGIKAFMDAGSALNQAEDELISMMLTGAFKSVHNVTAYRKDWVADKKHLSGGLKDGDSIPLDRNMPVNGKFFETVKTGEVPQDAMLMREVISRAFAENVFSNQIDLSGSLPGKQVRATELVQSQQAIGGVFESMAQDVEDKFIEPMAIEVWHDILQHSDDIPEAEMLAAFGEDRERGQAWLQMSPQERFEDAAASFRFRGKGIRQLAANAAKAQALVNFLSILGSNPAMMEVIQSQLSIPRVAVELAKGLGLDLEDIELSPEEQEQRRKLQQIREQALAQAELEGQSGGQQGQGSNPSQGTLPESGGFAPGSGQGGL